MPDLPPTQRFGTDRRMVYGARCVWWDTIDKVAMNGRGLPVCPFCGSVLYEEESIQKWWAQVGAYEQQFAKAYPNLAPITYRQFIEWGRGKCYPNYEIALRAFTRELQDLAPQQ